MDEIEIKAPAKINLFLRVLGQRPDGYHDIHSLFQAVSLYDIIYIKKTGGGINLTVSGSPGLPADSSNLVMKAARLMTKLYDLKGGLDIRLEKKIPVAAGLGGGSSDAAATIDAVATLYQLDLTTGEKGEIGLRLGSDVPFFFSSGQAEVTGRGEKLRELALPLDYAILLVNPPFSVSTAEGYRRLKLDLTRPNDDIKLLSLKDFKELVAGLKKFDNDFEKNSLKTYPVLGKIRSALVSAGASLARMSGSGPTFFGLFEHMPEGETWQQIIQEDWRLFRVRPITLPAWE